jgi:hypothetical protein
MGKLKSIPIKSLPRFVIYQANLKEFHICFEVKGELIRWSSKYAPTLDVRFPRKVKKIDNVAVDKIPIKQLFDEGTYMVNKTDTKESAEQKFTAGINEKTFAFILNGKKLKGRFSFKRVVGGTVIQKYKDQYAVEQDVLSDDLVRTISLMIPDYDEKKVTIQTKAKSSRQIAVKEESKLKTPGTDKIRKAQKDQKKPVIEKLTANKNIENIDYHFTFYNSYKKPDICLVTDAAGKCQILRKEGTNWFLLESIVTSRKIEEAFIKHTEALYRRKQK